MNVSGDPAICRRGIKSSAERMKQKNRRQSIDEGDVINGKERKNRADKRDKNALMSPRYIMHTRAYIMYMRVHIRDEPRVRCKT